MVMKEYHVTMKSCMPNQSKKTRNYNKSPSACPAETHHYQKQPDPDRERYEVMTFQILFFLSFQWN